MIRSPHHNFHAIGKRFAGEVCQECHMVIFPPRDLCPRCQDLVINIRHKPDLTEGGRALTGLSDLIGSGKAPEQVIYFQPGRKERK